MSFWKSFARIADRLLFLDQTRSMHVPICRGKSHLILVYMSPLWITALVRASPSPLALASVICTILCALCNFGSSAMLHNIYWTPERRSFISKLDYTGIFFMISGSCLCVPVLLLPPKVARVALCVQWCPTVVGVLAVWLGVYDQRKRACCRVSVYVIIGLLTGLTYHYLTSVLDPVERQHLLATGILYISGSCFYAFKAPNVWPGIIGYHELFHLCCFAAAVCTFRLNLSVLARARGLR